MGQDCNLTPTQHWELHQGLWHMLGCDMELSIRIKILLCIWIEKIIDIILIRHYLVVFI